MKYNCKICGTSGLHAPHSGAVDCIHCYKDWVNQLYDEIEGWKARLPKGDEILGMPVSRTGRVSLWLSGRFTAQSFDRLTRGVELLRDLFNEEEAERSELVENPDPSAPSTEASGVVQ